MTRKLNVLWGSSKNNPPEWTEAFKAALAPKHHFRTYDFDGPLEQFADIDVVIDIGLGMTHAMVDAARQARLWQLGSTGFDHLDRAYLKSKGIMAANCPGASSAVGLAECAMMFILMLTRKWHEAQGYLSQGVFYKPIGRSTQGLTLAIVGLGASGRELARRAKGFGMRIEVIHPRQPDSTTMAELQPDFVGMPGDLDQVLARCDFLSLHVNMSESTRHLIDERRLALMKPTACIINVARGLLVDEPAMYRALLAGKLGGAGLDVFSKEPPDMSEPAFRLPNVILFPHVSGATDETIRRRAAMALDNVTRVAEKRDILYRIA